MYQERQLLSLLPRAILTRLDAYAPKILQGRVDKVAERVPYSLIAHRGSGGVGYGGGLHRASCAKHAPARFRRQTDCREVLRSAVVSRSLSRTLLHCKRGKGVPLHQHVSAGLQSLSKLIMRSLSLPKPAELMHEGKVQHT